MSKHLNNVGSRVAAPAMPGVASTMFALGATRWAAFGLRVAIVGLVSAGATALDAYDSAPSAAIAPAAVVAQAKVAGPAPVAPVLSRAEAPAAEQQATTTTTAPDRMAMRPASPVARTEQPSTEQPSKDSRQGQDKVRELIRRGHCLGLGSCENDAAR